MSMALDRYWGFLKIFFIVGLFSAAVWIAFQKPALQDLPEWIWQIRSWKSGFYGMKLEPSLNYGLLGPYLGFEALRQGLGYFAIYVLWGFGGAALFWVRNGVGGLVEFAAFLFFPYFFWMGNIAFLDACLVALLFFYALEQGWSVWILMPLGVLGALMHGAVGLALLVYLCFHMAFSFLFQEGSAFLQKEAGVATCLFAIFVLQVCLGKTGSTGVAWGGLHYKIDSIVEAISAVTFADGVTLSSASGFCLVAFAVSLVCKVLWLVDGRRSFRADAMQWAVCVLVVVGCIAPTSLGALVRPDQRILFCGIVFYLFLSSSRGKTNSLNFKNILLAFSFLALFFSVISNLRYDFRIKKVSKILLDTENFHKILYSEILTKNENLKIFKIIPSYNEQRIVFCLENANPTPTFRTLFSWEKDPGFSKADSGICADLDGYQQQLCFRGLK